MERIKDRKFYEVRILSHKLRDDEFKVWDTINKIQSEKFCVHNYSFKPLIKNVNYFYVWLPRQDELQGMLSYSILA